MKPKLLLVIAVLIAGYGFAQRAGAQTTRSNPVIPGDSIIRKSNFFKSKPDTGIDKDILPYNGMPNAISKKNLPDMYVGNNGQGQDIYQSQMDNMAILKPDSSFQASMPNPFARKPAVKSYPSFGILPPTDYTPPKSRKTTPKFR